MDVPDDKRAAVPHTVRGDLLINSHRLKSTYTCNMMQAEMAKRNSVGSTRSAGNHKNFVANYGTAQDDEDVSFSEYNGL